MSRISVIQGLVVVENAALGYADDTMELWDIGLKTKYCQVSSTCGMGFTLTPTQYSLYTNENSKMPTMIEFDFEDEHGREFFIECGRYTVQVVIVDMRRANLDSPILYVSFDTQNLEISHESTTEENS